MPEAARFSAVEVLRDGHPVVIRSLTARDQAEMLAAVGRISSQSLYYRFFAVKRSFSEKEVAAFVKVDFIERVALVAEVEEGGRQVIVGGGRYIVVRPGTAELAFMVEDRYQGQGIGALLMRHLVALAREAGLEELIAEVLSENVPMLKVLQNSGLSCTTRQDGGVTQVALRVS